MFDLENQHENASVRDRNSENDAPSQEAAAKILIERADDLCSQLVAISRDQSEKKKECSTQLVAAIYGLHDALFARKQAYAAFLQERGIEPGKSTNEFADITRAVMEQRGRANKPPSITLYAQACHVLKSQSVAPEKAVQWLNEPDKRGGNRGKGRTGFGKTKPLWTESPEGRAESAKKRKVNLQKAKKYLNEQLQKSATVSSVGGMTAKTVPSMGTTGIALVEYDEAGGWQVRQVLTENPIKAAQTVRTCSSAIDADLEEPA